MVLYKYYIPKAEQMGAMIFVYAKGSLCAVPILASALVWGYISENGTCHSVECINEQSYVYQNRYYFLPTFCLFVILSNFQIFCKKYREKLYHMTLVSAIGEYSRPRRIGYFLTMLIVPWVAITHYYQTPNTQANIVIKNWFTIFYNSSYDFPHLFEYLRSSRSVIDNALLCGLLVQSLRYQILNFVALVREK